jgi:NAD(P)-dependent dehydrogenase (short-subunit alcohol dehydrogenase family)
MKVDGAVALVTGGNSGLGAATVRRFVGLGVEVIVLDLGPPDQQAPADADSPGVTVVAGDVRNPADVEAALEVAANSGKPLRVVVNCAGVAPAIRVLSKRGVHALADFTRAVEINLIGTFNVVRLAAERIAAQPIEGEEAGVIVNTASVAAFDGQIGQAAYAASKAGVAGLTLPLARDLAEYRIRVVTIAPGIFETPMLAGLPQPAQDSLGKQVPHPSRLGRPDEYASLVEHIISNPMLNGETIRLDGAIRLPPR